MFKDKLRELRKKSGESQYDLAKILSVAQSTVGNWESGKRQPDFDMAVKLAKHYNTTTDYLIGGNDALTPPNAEKTATGDGDGQSISDSDLKFAFWGQTDIDDELLNDVREYARFVKQRKDAQRKANENSK